MSTARTLPIDTMSHSNVCSQCSREVEILNGDHKFSMELHMQGHKSLDEISQNYEQLEKAALRLKENKSSSAKMIKCTDCKENIEIVNGDWVISLQLHTQKHKSVGVSCDPKERLHTSNSKIKELDNKNNTQGKTKLLGSSILERMFDTMPPGLKSHRNFILEDSGKVTCNICNTVIEHIFRLQEHLKTKLHEDNALLFVKEILPSDLHNIMEFVSFYDSNLFCNLCKSEIEMSSSNPHNTIVNIIAHNTSKIHSDNSYFDETDQLRIEGSILLKSLTHVNPMIQEKEHFIEYKIKPVFECKLCLELVSNKQKENDLLKDFVAHLEGVFHNQCLRAMSLLKTFEKAQAYDKGAHNIIRTGNTICCTFCNCAIEASFDKLVLHVIEYNESIHPSVPNTAATMSDLKNESHVGRSHKSNHKPAKAFLELSSLVNSLPEQVKNTYILKEINGRWCVVCLSCNLEIPATTRNLTDHLSAKKHKTKVKKVMSSEKKCNEQLSKDINSSETIDKVYDLLMNSDLGIAANSKIISKYVDRKHYLCVVCNDLIEGSLNVDVFSNRLHSHISTNEHKHKLELHSMLSKVIEYESLRVKALFKSLQPCLVDNIIYIKALKYDIDSVFCALCFLNVPANSESLQNHLEGWFHAMSVDKFNTVRQDLKLQEDTLLNNILKKEKIINNAAKYLTKVDDQLYCSLCKCKLSPSQDEHQYRRNLLDHIEGQKHKKKVKNVLCKMFEKL